MVDRDRIVTIAAAGRAQIDRIHSIAGAMPASKAYRDGVRGDLVRMAGDGRLQVRMARTFPLADAIEAVDLLLTGHPGGKLALVP
jgi:hypothetical protein